jgi:RND family efflux transporter MFP subunit
MNEMSAQHGELGAGLSEAAAFQPGRTGRGRLWLITGTIVLAIAGGLVAWRHFGPNPVRSPAHATQRPPEVTVATPLQEIVAPTTSFLGQFSAVDTVELRAQVGGILTEIAFHDGQIVTKGAPLLTIDPRPYRIRLDQVGAQLQTALARKSLADAELWRAQQLRQSSFGTVESVDQRAAEQRGAQAAIQSAQAAVRDAQLDLEFSEITAPFDGKIGTHLVSVGSLVSGGRAGGGASTLLATVVSLDPIHIDFDMSEAEFLAYQRARKGASPDDAVEISLAGDSQYDVKGHLDFIDNVVDRSSGTIHARATVPNPELSLTPGQFARVRLALGQPVPALLVPGAAVIPDQSQSIVMTVGTDGKVVARPVEVGGLAHGLRIVRSGLDADDRVVINGLVRVRPGVAVTPVPGTITPAPGDE